MKVYHENLGTVNKNKVTIETNKGYVRLYFSYQTIVGVDNTICENNWGPTTGKLLNELEPDKSKRVSQEKVNAEVEHQLKKILGGK